MLAIITRCERIGTLESRFRKRHPTVAISPIIMTTFAAIFGAIPLALSFGEGGEMRRPLGKPMLRTLTRKREANVIAKEIAVVV
jgi:hypothetical protein